MNCGASILLRQAENIRKQSSRKHAGKAQLCKEAAMQGITASEGEIRAKYHYAHPLSTEFSDAGMD
jgi:hypothetical protein